MISDEMLKDAAARTCESYISGLLSDYDPEIKPVAEAIAPLDVLNAMSVDELKAQLAEAKDKIEAARQALVK